MGVLSGVDVESLKHQSKREEIEMTLQFEENEQHDRNGGEAVFVFIVAVLFLIVGFASGWCCRSQVEVPLGIYVPTSQAEQKLARAEENEACKFEGWDVRLIPQDPSLQPETLGSRAGRRSPGLSRWRRGDGEISKQASGN